MTVLLDPKVVGIFASFSLLFRFFFAISVCEGSLVGHVRLITRRVVLLVFFKISFWEGNNMLKLGALSRKKSLHLYLWVVLERNSREILQSSG